MNDPVWFSGCCSVCGTFFSVIAQRNIVIRHCSKRCKQIIKNAIGRNRHRAIKAGVEQIDVVDSFAVYARDKYTCQLCGKIMQQSTRSLLQLNEPVTDHIIPLSMGSSYAMSSGNTYDNCQTVCRRCNDVKAAAEQVLLCRQMGAMEGVTA